MQMNGYTFSHPDYEHSFIVPGTGDRDDFCAGIEDTSYCGFYHPGEGVLSITMRERGTVDINYGSSYSNGDQYVTIDKNGVEVDRVTGIGRGVDNRASYTMDVLPGDGLKMIGCGTTEVTWEHGSCDENDNCIPMPSSWRCNMMRGLETATDLHNIVALQENGTG